MVIIGKRVTIPWGQGTEWENDLRIFKATLILNIRFRMPLH